MSIKPSYGIRKLEGNVTCRTHFLNRCISRLRGGLQSLRGRSWLVSETTLSSRAQFGENSMGSARFVSWWSNKSIQEKHIPTLGVCLQLVFSMLAGYDDGMGGIFADTDIHARLELTVSARSQLHDWPLSWLFLSLGFNGLFSSYSLSDSQACYTLAE